MPFFLDDTLINTALLVYCTNTRNITEITYKSNALKTVFVNSACIFKQSTSTIVFKGEIDPNKQAS